MSTSRYLQAKRFATEAHAGQQRSSGEPFINHLLAVADILKTIHADDDTLTAGVLHDILEDTSVTARTLRKKFGPVVTKLVEGVTKVERAEKVFDKKQRNMESIRKMFHVMGKDIRVLFIKLADRLHNMQTLSHVSEEKRVRVARETQDIYVPLANLLGIRAWYEQLDDLCFQVLDPVEHELIERKRMQNNKQSKSALQKWVNALQEYLRKAGIRAAVSLVPRHAREVRIMSREQEDVLQDIETFYVVHVRTKNVDDCYRCLGLVHAFALPLPLSASDYIALPKVNGYQALHTNVLSGLGGGISVTLQTKEMESHAQLGTAALYQQRGGVHSEALPRWVAALTSLEEQEQDLQRFFLQVKQEIFAEHGRVHIVAGKQQRFVDVPAHSSVLDLAFYASPAIGASVEAAKVNGKHVGIKHIVHDGDSVEFVTTKRNDVRTVQDMYCIHTSLAHQLLVNTLSASRSQKQQQRGKAALVHAIDSMMDPFFSVRWHKSIVERMEGDTSLLRKIGCGTVDAFLHVEKQTKPQECFLLNPLCFHFASGIMPASTIRYVLHTTVDVLQKGRILGLQTSPDVIDVIAADDIEESRTSPFSKEIVPLKLREEYAQFPFYFALRWTFLSDTNPLADIAKLQSLLDTPVKLLQFDNTSVTLGFLTDSLMTFQIAYKYLYGLPTVSDIFRITP